MIRINTRPFVGLLVFLCVIGLPVSHVAAFADSLTAPKALPPATLAKIQSLLATPELADAQIGVSIVALGKVDKADQFPSRPYGEEIEPELFASNSEKRFLPASNMKLFTAAMAAKAFVGESHFSTRVWGAHPLEYGELMGPLELEGGGDPSFDVDGLRDLARQIAKKGIRKVHGVVLRHRTSPVSRPGAYYPEGWTLDDALWYYGPEIPWLSFHRNQLDVIVTGGAKEGDPAKVELEAGFPQFRLGHEIRADIRTGGAELAGKDGEDLLYVDRVIGAPSGPVVISGLVAPGRKVTVGIAVPNPSGWALKVFRLELERAGVKVLDTPAPAQKTASNGAARRTTYIAEHDSAPVGALLKRFLKNSDNLYGEILWRKAAGVPDPNPRRTERNARQKMESFVRSLGIDTRGLRFSDGSGLSRYNLITPQATTRLLAGIERIRADSVWDALPIAGVDGTLKNRMKGTAAQGNVRAKTGTFSIVSCLSGYVTTHDGHRLAVSILTNFARNGNDARVLQNNIFTVLAEAKLIE